MRAVHFHGNKVITLDEVPLPQPEGENVLVRIKATAICGTDRENLVGEGQPRVPGHESAGEIVQVDRPLRVKPGDRVAINCHITCGACSHCLSGDLYFCPELRIVGFDIDGGFAEYALIPERCCMPLPNDVSYEVGSLLVDMLGTAYRAVKRAGLTSHDKVAVFGAGPVGLAALITARWFGAQVALIDSNPYRLSTGISLGADLIIDFSKDNIDRVLNNWTSSHGVDVSFECSGNRLASQSAIRVTRQRGKLAIVGVSRYLEIDPWVDLIENELTIYGSRCFVLSEYEEMMAMVRKGLRPERIISHRFPLSQAEEAFAVYLSTQCNKVILTEP